MAEIVGTALGCSVLVALASAAPPPEIAYAASTTFYVAPTGSDSNPGTQTAPWRTIQKAANTLTAGQTVLVQAGTYNERVTVARSGTAGNLITFQAQGTVSMKGFSISGSYVRVDGFEITNLAASGVNPSAHAAVFTSGDFNEIRNTSLHDLGAWGVYLDTAASDNTVVKNQIVKPGHCGIWIRGTNHVIEGNDISRSQQHPALWTNQPSWVDADGIIIEGSGHTLRQNVIHDIYAADPGQTDPHVDCFQIPTVAVSNVVLEQNVCRDLPRGPTGRATQASMFQGTIQNLTIRNNVIHDVARGFNFDGSPGQITSLAILNNTFVNLSDYGVSLGSAVVPNPLIRNNVFHSVRSPYVALGSNSAGGVGNNLSYPTASSFAGDLSAVNPLFLNLAGDDFHLMLLSPAIDKGVASALVTNDFDGLSRPQGLAHDLGAFEYGSPSRPPAASLANASTLSAHSANFDPANPVEHLWDGCLDGTSSCTAGDAGITSFWVEFDLGQLYDLTLARLFGDAQGTWWSKTWQLQYRQTTSAPWSTAFSNVNAFLADWSVQPLAVQARYVRVEVFGNPAVPATEARELELYGTPSILDTTPPTTPAPPDTAAPVLQTLVLTIQMTGATLTWQTNEASTSLVQYGTTTAYGATVGDGALVTTHTVSLSGLSPATTYHYRLQSADAAGNQAVSADLTFTTTPF